jgi:hypothetical protein
MSSQNSPATIYYKFTEHLYDDLSCDKFNNSITERNFCNDHKYQNIDACCVHVAKMNNIVLNSCANYSMFMCESDPYTTKPPINSDFLIIMGIICLIIIGICISYIIIKYILTYASYRSNYTRIN